MRRRWLEQTFQDQGCCSWSIMVFLLLIATLAACTPRDREIRGSDVQDGSETAEPSDEWSALRQRGAYPFISPLPPAETTVIDGTYVKFDPKVATPIPCRRCPDYMNEGGVWKLSFDRGTFHILHLVTGWTGIGSYSIEGNQLAIFNDPKCPDLVGYYSWRMVEDGLALSTIDDHCAADMRSHNLEQMVWRRCPVSNESREIDSDVPPGC